MMHMNIRQVQRVGVAVFIGMVAVALLLSVFGMVPRTSGTVSRKGKSAYEGNRFAVVRPGEQAGYSQRATLWHRGKEVYEHYCVGCHGQTGEGDGPASLRLITKPRNFTKGIYKFRSTDSSSLPLESDLHRTISRGLSRVSMPAFPLMPEPDKVAVIQYIKAFYPQWDEQAPKRVVIYVPHGPEDIDAPQRAARGRAVYLGVGCASCHGVDGRGKGATLIAYTDAWDHQQLPFDFTLGRLKGGDDPEDVYRTFHTGLRSVMPGFGPDSMTSVTQQALDGALTDEQKAEIVAVFKTFPVDRAAVDAMTESGRKALVQGNSWDLVSYVRSLQQTKRTK